MGTTCVRDATASPDASAFRSAATAQHRRATGHSAFLRHDAVHDSGVDSAASCPTRASSVNHASTGLPASAAVMRSEKRL
jgi:hypothetical protein